MSVKKRIKEIIAAVVILAVICTAMWNIGWLSSWKEIAFLYTLLGAEIVITIIIDTVKNRYHNK